MEAQRAIPERTRRGGVRPGRRRSSNSSVEEEAEEKRGGGGRIGSIRREAGEPEEGESEARRTAGALSPRE